MDEFKHYIYARDPKRYEKVDAGDLSYQFYIKEKLKCKPFSYFIENVASDMLEFYPLVDPPPFAQGVVSEVSHFSSLFFGQLLSDSKYFETFTLH